MNFQIRRFTEADMEPVIRLSLLAWEPVFLSFKQILGPHIFALLYPDWQSSQAKGVQSVCMDGKKFSTWLAERDGNVAGFVAYTINVQEKTGEIELLAVQPDDQNQGIGTALTEFVTRKMRESGVNLAVVATGGDASHAPARRCYEKAGYTGLPLVRYYKDLSK